MEVVHHPYDHQQGRPGEQWAQLVERNRGDQNGEQETAEHRDPADQRDLAAMCLVPARGIHQTDAPRQGRQNMDQRAGCQEGDDPGGNALHRLRSRTRAQDTRKIPETPFLRAIIVGRRVPDRRESGAPDWHLQARSVGQGLDRPCLVSIYPWRVSAPESPGLAIRIRTARDLRSRAPVSEDIQCGSASIRRDAHRLVIEAFRALDTRHIQGRCD